MLGYAFSNPNLGEGLCIFTSFHFPDARLKLLNGSDFHFDLFKWRDTENQQQGMWCIYMLHRKELEVARSL